MRVTDLPPLVLEQRDFYELYEYSWSLPTGTRIGKTWRRRVEGVPHWVIGRYGRIPGDDQHVAIDWYRPCVIPNGATLLERGPLWVGRFRRLTVVTPSWLWAWRELWREAGEPASQDLEHRGAA